MLTLKKWIPIVAGCLVVFLVGCSNDDANEEEKNNSEEESSESSEEPEPENIVSLIEQLTFDSNVESTEEGLDFNFHITNEADEPIILGFNSSQKYEIVLENADGEEVYKYSNEQAFSQQLTTEELDPGDKLEANETLEEELPAGEYDATMSFLVTSINDQPLETKPFEITDSVTVGSGESGQEADAEEEAEGEEQVREEIEAAANGEEIFRELTLTGENGQYNISGEAKVDGGEFFYSVDDGHNVYIEEETAQVDDPNAEWSPFELDITVNEEDLPENGALIMTMFDRDGEGQPINMNFVPLDNFES
ncbi:hypothetical protein GCM10010954_12850 [Halobacillus andaensis]|uniref:Intracellular proteinase inhibitor BsuPI domain-containing protein n=1 Tax=Halobacillus andaensis TaxID=1176239 RepID=A0A917ETY6_HALAA|nr:BsuPI-related putative proteinase inhibitor [Halobacillus andaensis]MBP2004081.1 hypothetical protein [Halobacillus andaensis]GGF15625.1 hypothetical protein GCM10010954_12850 [Halobacillus andaensis]